MTNGRAETLRILANAFDELEQLRLRLRDDSEHVRHAMDAARNDERAAVVAWLRDFGSEAWLTDGGLSLVCLDEIADKFERGEHRLEEKP